MIKNKKLAIITIHKGDFKNLKKTVLSVDRQTIFPDLHLLIIKKIGFNHSRIYINEKRKVIISNDNSLYEAMNIGIENSKDFNIVFLNSGDVFHSQNSVEFIKSKICGLKCLIFKTNLILNNNSYFPTNFFFNNLNYSPHPSFIRPPVIKPMYFQVYPKTFSDSIWMRKYRNSIGVKKINKTISNFFIHDAEVSSTVPSIKSIKWHINSSFIELLKEIIKFLIYNLIGKKKYYAIIFFKKFKLN